MSRLMRRLVLGVWLTGMLCLVFIGDHPSGGARRSRPLFAADETTKNRSAFVDLKSKTPARVRIEGALTQVTQMEFIGTPLSDAIDFLRDQHKIPILIDEVSLLSEGIATDEPINRVLSDVSLRSGLNVMLDPLGLDYVIEDEVLKIMTALGASERMETHVYDVRGLVKSGIEPDALAQVIEKTVRSESWQRDETTDSEAGASKKKPADRRGVVEVLSGSLVITQSQRVHAEIADLLEQLARVAEREQSEFLPRRHGVGQEKRREWLRRRKCDRHTAHALVSGNALASGSFRTFLRPSVSPR